MNDMSFSLGMANEKNSILFWNGVFYWTSKPAISVFSVQKSRKGVYSKLGYEHVCTYVLVGSGGGKITVLQQTFKIRNCCHILSNYSQYVHEFVLCWDSYGQCCFGIRLDRALRFRGVVSVGCETGVYQCWHICRWVSPLKKHIRHRAMQLCLEGFDIMRPEHNSPHIAHDFINYISLNHNYFILIQISAMFSPGGWLDNTSVLVQVLIWSWPGSSWFILCWPTSMTRICLDEIIG